MRLHDRLRSVRNLSRPQGPSETRAGRMRVRAIASTADVPCAHDNASGEPLIGAGQSTER
jgi:hypothetical protein